MIKKLDFKMFLELNDYQDVYSELTHRLQVDGVDLKKFNESLRIILEWEFNPFKSFGKSAMTSAGAVAGSAFGPVGTAIGGLAGNLAGNLVSKISDKYISGAKIKSISPFYQQAVQAVDSLSQLLNNPDLQSYENSKNLKSTIDNIKQNLGNLGNDVTSLDSQRNQDLDSRLSAWGGLGQKLRYAQGDGKLANLQRQIGEKIKDIPVLNKDMGLRRALVQGMDSLQNWAKENPNKAKMINLGSMLTGGVMGGLAAGQWNKQNPQDQQSQNPQNQQVQNQQVQQDPQQVGSQASKNSVSGLSWKDPNNSKDYHWNDDIGNFTTTTGDNGETLYHSKDGNIYKKSFNVIGKQVWQRYNPQSQKFEIPRMHPIK